MNDRDRTITDLNAELERLRRRIAELESWAAGAGRPEARRANEKRYQLLLDTMIHGVQENDCSGVITYSNRAHHRILGYEPGEIVGKTIWQLLPPGEEQGALQEYLASLVKEQPTPAPYLSLSRKKDGSLVDLQIDWDYQRDDEGRLKGFISVITDITDRKLAEAKIRKITRLCAFLSQINQAIVRTKDRDELFRNICQVAIDFGQFRMAWVGMIDEATGIVRPAAHTGREEGYLNVLSIRIGDEVTGRGPTGSALREGALTICDDIATDTRMVPWREEALKRGYRSSAAIPFRMQEKVIGSLNLYASEPGFFTEDERKLLTEIGVDISFALDALEREKERKRAEEDLHHRTQGLATLLDLSKSFAATLNMEDVLQAATDGVTKLFGLDTAAVYLVEGTTLRLWATTPPLPPQFPEELRNAPLVDHPRIRESFTSGTPVFVPDMVTADLTPAERAVTEQRGLRSVLFLPLIAGVKSVGTLIVGSVAQPRAIKAAEIDLCRTLANLAALAVENARLYKIGQQYTAELERRIFERIRAEDALRESEERLKLSLEAAHAGSWEWDMASNKAVWSDENFKVLGLTPGDIEPCYDTWLRSVHQDDKERVIGQMADIVRSQGKLDIEFRIVHPDGTIRWINDRGEFILDGTGKAVRMRGIQIDITDRKRAEEALRESEERLRLALSAAKQGLYDLNVQTGEAVVTPEYARMLGYAPEEFIETNAKWIERLHPDDRVPVADTYRAYVSGALPEYRVEFRQRTRSGEWKWILSIGKIVAYDASGNPLRMLGTHTDITDRKRTEQERLELERRLLHAQKLESLGILAGGIAHDFNNLLMAVLGNLDLALQKLSPVSPARLNIEQSAQAARRAADLTRQMLAYSGKGRFVVKAMDLSELVEENTHLFRASVARTAALNVHLDRSLPAIEADAGQVQQVIMNLITNASEATGDKAGVITITTGVEDCDAQCLKQSRIDDVPDAGRFVVLEVSDNGCGMDEQTQQRLFDPFFTTKATGRGLGMSAILGIVRGHRGAIFVDSATGRGTTIRILFPALQGARAVKEEPVSARAGEAAAPAMSGTVLVVDDEEIVRNVCRDMVDSLGLQVLTAVDGRDGVEVFTKHAGDIDLVILDLSMPNMDGMTAFRELVRIRPGVKIILCSGYDELDSIQRLSGQGLAGFIQKPYSLKNLREALEKAGVAGG